VSAQEFKAPASVDRLQRAGMFAGGVAALIAVYGLTKSPADFYHSYIFSYMLILGLTVGSLGLLMLQHLTGGIWGMVIRRPLEAASESVVDADSVCSHRDGNEISVLGER